MIRKATARDIAPLVQLLKLLFSLEADFNFDERCQARGLTLLLESENAVIVVAEDEGIVVGMATGQLTLSTAEGGPALLVEDVVVAPAWHRQGLGRELLDFLENWAKLNKVSRLQLLADRNNLPALGFYSELQWQPTELICLRKKISA